MQGMEGKEWPTAYLSFGSRSKERYLVPAQEIVDHNNLRISVQNLNIDVAVL